MTTSTLEKDYLAPNWEQQNLDDDNIDPDFKIDAYFIGKKEGFEEGKGAFQKEREESFNNNLKEFMELTEKLKENLSGSGILVKNMYLKPNSLSHFQSLIVIDRNHYTADSRKSIYSLADAVSKECQNTKGEFTFMGYSESVNELSILSDGFVFKYVQNTKTRSRKA